ncbi:hypothetical protein [Demequina flava]|uniref:hypothetical protein n=1 Tax=Demequina flava TaxID=1095025 RepID=UPI0007848F9F|nr:hypothetical protein [Demequina flava]
MPKKFYLLARKGMIRLNDTDNGAGGGSTPPEGGTPPAAPSATPPATPPATPTPPAAPEGDKGNAWDGKVESLPSGAQDLIRQLRSENAQKRTKASEAETAQRDAVMALAKAVGLELPEGAETPDPAAMAQQLVDSQTEAKDAHIELEVYRTARDHGGDPARLTDSRTFLAKVADLDPTDEDFTTQVTDAAKAAVTANPSLTAVQVAGQSTVQHPGGSGEKAITVEQFKAMKPAERNELFQTDPDLYRQLTGR